MASREMLLRFKIVLDKEDPRPEAYTWELRTNRGELLYRSPIAYGTKQEAIESTGGVIKVLDVACPAYADGHHRCKECGETL